MHKWFRTKIIALLGVVTVFFMAPSIAYACSCAYPPKPAEALAEAKAVFAGTVKEIRPTSYGKEILFEVNKTWKGVNQTQVLVSTGGGGGDCGYNFNKGSDYVVYAHTDTFYSKSGGLATNICNRTADLSSAEEDIAILGQGNHPGEQVNLETNAYARTWLIAALIAVALFGAGWRFFRKRA